MVLITIFLDSNEYIYVYMEYQNVITHCQFPIISGILCCDRILLYRDMAPKRQNSGASKMAITRG
jgi:hypothetical protein